jgi:outer membrane protein TolC
MNSSASYQYKNYALMRISQTGWRSAKAECRACLGYMGKPRLRGGEASQSGSSVTVSWEADVWGRVQAGANAAEENLRATVADFEFARQSLAEHLGLLFVLQCLFRDFLV